MRRVEAATGRVEAAAPSAEGQRQAYRWTSPGDVAVAAGIALRSADGSVVFPGAPAPPAPPQGAGAPLAVSTAQPAPARAVQIDSDEVPTAGTITSATGDSDTGVPPERDLAALTEALYERIEYRLRTDLMHERERLGCLPDL